MNEFNRASFGRTVAEDFVARRQGAASAFTASAGVPQKALGHPDYEDLAVGDRATAPMVAVFLDLTNFTGRTFWDDQEEVVDLAHAVLSGFVQTVRNFGGHPLGLRGDGLFAGFSPGDPAFTATMALGACASALDAVENAVNPWLDRSGMARVQARAGLDYGPITFVRSGDQASSEINPLGFAANFAAKCEKQAASWEIVVGEGLYNLLPSSDVFDEHEKSPKQYSRDYRREYYRFYDYRWRRTVPHLDGIVEALAGNVTAQIQQAKR